MEEYLDIQCHQDEWTIITANTDTKTKNTLTRVCTTLNKISSQNNLELYRCNSLNLSPSQKQYALYYALYKRQPDIVNNLCAFGADITMSFLARSPRLLQLYYDPLTVQTKTNNAHESCDLPQCIAAAYFGDMDYLKKYCSDEDIQLYDAKTDFSALQLAAMNGHNAAVELLLQHKSIEKVINKKNNTYGTPLYLATFFGHFYNAQLLFKHPQIDLSIYNNNNTNPLYVACNKGYEDLLQFFITHKPEWLDVYFNEFTPLLAASNCGHLSIIKIILTLRPEQIHQTTQRGATPLYIASEQGQHEAVKLLCKRGVDKNKRFNNHSPLHVASHNNHPKVVKILVSYPDILINCKNSEGASALCIASEGGYSEIVKYLLDREDVDLTIDCDGNKPLHLAAHKNHVDVVQLLLDHTPQLINIVNKEGNTALHVAVLQGNLDTIALLLTKKILVNVFNQANKTPLNCALDTGNQTIIDLLKEHSTKTYQEICGSKL